MQQGLRELSCELTTHVSNVEGEVRKRATTDDQIFTIVDLLKDYILGKHASYQIRCQTKKTTRSNNLKVSSDGQEKRFWLFDFDGVAVNLQIPLVNTACNAIWHVR